MPINSLLYPANSAVSGGYDVDNSCRFDSASSADLRISDYSGAGTSRRTRTYSMWIKRSELSYAVIFGSSGKDHWVFTAGNKIQINIGSGTDSRRITDMVFRDVSAWYHIVFAYDTTQGTASNRFTMWVNGAVATTSIVSGKNEVAQNEDANVFINNDTSTIASDEDSASYFDGYMAEWVFVDGQKLDADSFGEYDEDSGIWKPIDVSGITLGTNGFYLNFQTASDLGIDAGNDNDFEPTNLTAIDQSTDTCTNNFATMNPLDNFYANSTLTEGNLKIATASGREASNTATIALTSGKWFWEYKQGSGSPNSGIQPVPTFGNTASNAGLQINGFAYLSTGKVETSNGSGGSNVLAQYATFGTNDIIGTAIDLDSSQNKIYFYKNGALQGSGVNITSVGSTTNGHYLIAFAAISGTTSFEINFGGTNTYSISSGNADGNGFGNFEYAPKSGHLAICTKNLAESG